MNKGKDRASKLFFSDKRNAKDLVSLVLRRLGIEEEPKEVEEADPVLSFMDRKFSLERLLDKLFKVTLSNEETSTFCFVGLENQSKFDAHMLIRAGIASLLLYDRALQRKEKLKPVVIAVLNMSDGKWKGPVSLVLKTTEFNQNRPLILTKRNITDFNQNMAECSRNTIISLSLAI